MKLKEMEPKELTVREVYEQELLRLVGDEPFSEFAERLGFEEWMYKEENPEPYTENQLIKLLIEEISNPTPLTLPIKKSKPIKPTKPRKPSKNVYTKIRNLDHSLTILKNDKPYLLIKDGVKYFSDGRK